MEGDYENFDVTAPPTTPDSEETMSSLKNSELLEDIYNLSRQLLQDNDSDKINLATGIMNLASSALQFNGSDSSLSGDFNGTAHVNLTSNGVPLNTTNVTVTSRGGGVQYDSEDAFGNDAAWILTATFIIFTMQSGFGLLESGCVSMKNETNIMVKNVVDVVLGGFTYWLFGYALSFALVASKMVGPRIGRYDDGEGSLPMGSPTNAILGMFMLWWGWLGFNCGSTFGINGDRWKYAARTAVTTLQSSIGGGLAGMSFSWYKNHRLEVGDVVNSVLGALVSITAGCALFTTWEALFIGIVGGLISVLAMPVFDKFHIDDPVGATSVHGLCGIWAMVSIGLFVQADTLLGMTGGYSGLFRGGGFYLLGVQSLACLCISVWAMLATFIILFVIDRFMMTIRMSEWEELVGADFAEHGIRRRNVGVSRAVSVLGLHHNGFDYSDILPQGDNPCHVKVLGDLEVLNSRRGSTLSKALAQVTKNSFKTALLPSFLLNGKAGKEPSKQQQQEAFTTTEVTPIENPASLSAWQ